MNYPMRFFLCVLFTISSLTLFGYDLSICTIFQNEAPYLKEWIEFHKLQGVEHFYLYNNNSTDDYLKVLNPYIKSKEVTLTDWSNTYMSGMTYQWLEVQQSAYKHCIKVFGPKTKWLAVIDSDEYLFCPNGEPITHFLSRYTSFAGVCVNWLQFGTSGLKTIPKGVLMIEALTKCSAKNHPKNLEVKSIVQPQYVADCFSPHFFYFRKGYFAVGADGNRISGMNSPYTSLDKIRINHYWTRAEDHFNEKKVKSRQNRRHHENAAILQSRADEYNVSTDTAILQFVPALRKKAGLN